jgi:hypothetical protein
MQLDDTYRPDAPVQEDFVQFWKIVSVNLDASPPYALGELADGTQRPFYAMQGYLAQEGDFCPAFKNGGDPVIVPARWMADGSMQSINFVPGASGWMITADGDCEFNSGVFRADITGALFRTATSGARVEIDSVNFIDEVRFYSGDPTELLPGTVRAFKDATQGTLELVSPEFPSGGVGEHAIVRVGVDLVSGETFADVVADNIRSNGVSISKPPYSAKRRLNPSASIASSATANAVVVWDTDLKVNWESFITYDGGGTFTITKAGIWEVSGYISWIDGSGFGDGNRRYYVTENGTDRIIGNMAAAGNTGNNTIHPFKTDVYVSTDSPFTLQVKAGQQNGFAGGLTLTGRVTIRRTSG